MARNISPPLLLQVLGVLCVTEGNTENFPCLTAVDVVIWFMQIKRQKEPHNMQDVGVYNCGFLQKWRQKIIRACRGRDVMFFQVTGRSESTNNTPGHVTRISAGNKPDLLLSTNHSPPFSHVIDQTNQSGRSADQGQERYHDNIAHVQHFLRLSQAWPIRTTDQDHVTKADEWETRGEIGWSGQWEKLPRGRQSALGLTREYLAVASYHSVL